MSRRHAVTTGYVLAIIALTLTVVPAGAERQTVSPTAAVTTLAALKPPPGMLAALQRDLGLTAAQAQTRLLNEARMTPVVPRLQRALGARFGGAWFRGTTAQNLVVATTSIADIPQILAAGAKAEVVTWPLAHLASIKKKLDQALPMRPIVASVRYVDAKTNRVVVLAPKPEAAETLVEGAGVDKAVVVVLPSNEQPRPLYDLVGGQTYYVGDTTRCSIGFPVFKVPRTVSSPPATAASRARPPPASTGSPKASSRHLPSRPTTTPGSPSTPTGRRSRRWTTVRAAPCPSSVPKWPSRAPRSAGPVPPPTGTAASSSSAMPASPIPRATSSG